MAPCRASREGTARAVLEPPEHFYARALVLKPGMVRYNATGTLRYCTYWAMLDIDPELVRYYRSLIPAYLNASPQKYDAHISVVRKDREVVQDWTAWGKYAGEEVEYQYEPTLMYDNLYFWLPAWSERVGDIREELGLPRVREGFTEYHITLANIKV